MLLGCDTQTREALTLKFHSYISRFKNNIVSRSCFRSQHGFDGSYLSVAGSEIEVQLDGRWRPLCGEFIVNSEMIKL